MEENLLPRPAVRRELAARYIEAWLHSDHEKLGEKWQQLERDFIGYTSNPYFVMIDPRTRKEIRRLDYTKDEALFLRFLRGE